MTDSTLPASTLPASTLHVLGALALELAPGSSVARDALAQAEAGALAALLARDLAGFAPEAVALELVTVGAHFDAVELLRPGWPLHRALDQLAARAPGAMPDSGRIVAFGAHADRLPGALTPAEEFRGGPLRLLPFLLRTTVPTGAADVVAGVGDTFERERLERGMAAADTALAAQAAFGLRVEHARYLTVHDLAAMSALQYEHAGLAALWPVLETALLAPDDEAWLDAPPEPLLHYAGREARIALFDPQAWRARYQPGSSGPGNDRDCARLERQFERFEARQRQFAAVLQAHAVAVTFVHCDDAARDREQLA
jgi:hypothetical protein